MMDFEENKKLAERRQYFERILRKFEMAGIHMPTNNLRDFLETIQSKVKEDLHLYLGKKATCDTMADYFVKAEAYYGNTSVGITDEGIGEMLKAISFLKENNTLLTDAELVTIMLTQFIRLHCVSLSSKRYCDTPHNVVAIITTNVFMKRCRNNEKHYIRVFSFVPRIYS